MNSGYSPEKWTEKLNKLIQSRPTMKMLSELLKEGEEIGVSSESLAALRDFMEVMERWVAEAERVLDLKADSNKSVSKGRIERIQSLLEQTRSIGYEFPHVPQLKEYLDKLLAYEATITDGLMASNDKQAQYPVYVEGKSLRADSKRFIKLRGIIKSYSWLAEVEKVLNAPYNAKSIRKLIKDATDLGIAEGPWPERLNLIEQEAKRCLQFIENLCRGRQKIELHEEQSVFSIGQNHENPQLSFTLEPHLLIRLQNAMARSKVILNQVEDMLTTKCTKSDILERPAYADGQKLMSICREIVFKSEKVQRLSEALSSMNVWNETVRATFMHGRQKSLEYVLRETLSNVENITLNHQKLGLYCICRKPESGLMIACDICKEWYHNPCVRVPRSVVRSSISYVCPICNNEEKKNLAHISRRPTLEELQRLMDIAQPLMFCPKDYSLVKSIYDHTVEFRAHIQSSCYSYMNNQSIDEIGRYLRCLEGLEVQLPEETRFLKEKLQTLTPPQPLKTSVLKEENKEAELQPPRKERSTVSNKLSISALLHTTEPDYYQETYKPEFSAVQNNNNSNTGFRYEQSESMANNPSRLLLKTNSGTKRPAEDTLSSPKIQKVKLTVRPPTPQPIINKKRQYSDVGSVEQDYEYGQESIMDCNREHAGSSKLAFFNVVCVVAGTGTLGLPQALQQGGWIGLFVIFLSWLMSVYTGILLIRCLYSNGKTRLNTYKDVATAAFGTIGGWVTFFFNAWIVLGVPVLYTVLAGSNLNQLCKGTVAEIGHVPWTIICCAIVAIPYIIIKSMKEVAWMSAFGALATIVVVLIVLVCAAIDRPNHMDAHHEPVIWDMFPIALSTISFSFGGNVVYPHVEASMKKPRDWPKVIAGGLTVCAVLYIVTAVTGYLVYGDQVLSPVYDSIPAGVAQTVAIVIITLHVLMAAPILITSFSLDIEEMFNLTVERFGKVKEFLIRATLRILVMVLVGVIACSVPHFGALMSLIGAFANCALIFIFPVTFYLKLTGVRNKPFYQLIWCGLTVLLGLVGLIFGTKEAVQELIVAFK
ncbi:hypothetical protein G6F43_009262 [Rhizopus delemar]|nr:hypothetical protein G6F43_009262 [Rhizopus delemar]